MEATFATMLFREMSKQKDAIDFTKLLNAFTTPGQDPQEWDTKLTSIKNLVQATLDHYKTLCPQDPQQAILEQLEKLKAENAALKAGQVLDSTDPANPPPTSGQSSQVAAQPKQPGQAHLGNYFASPSASPPPMHQPTPWRPIDARMEHPFMQYTHPNQVQMPRFEIGSNDTCPRIDKINCPKVLIASKMS